MQAAGGGIAWSHIATRSRIDGLRQRNLSITQEQAALAAEFSLNVELAEKLEAELACAVPVYVPPLAELAAAARAARLFIPAAVEPHRWQLEMACAVRAGRHTWVLEQAGKGKTLVGQILTALSIGGLVVWIVPLLALARQHEASLNSGHPCLYLDSNGELATCDIAYMLVDRSDQVAVTSNCM